MYCTRLDENTGRKKSPKIAISTPSHNFVRLYLRNYGTYRQSEKNLLNSNVSSTCSTIWRTSAHQQLRSVRELAALPQISTVVESWLRYCSDVAHRRPIKLCMMFGRLLGWYTIHVYTFLEAFSPDGSLPGAKFTLRPSLAFSYIGSVTARHSSSGRQPDFAAWYKEWN